MTVLSENILMLHGKGMKYTEIASELNCSLSTISYHVSEGQKIKTSDRSRRRNKTKRFVQSMYNFWDDRGNPTTLSEEDIKGSVEKRIKHKVKDYQRDKNGEYKMNFTYEELIEKIGEEPVCYLTGRKNRYV